MNVVSLAQTFQTFRITQRKTDAGERRIQSVRVIIVRRAAGAREANACEILELSFVSTSLTRCVCDRGPEKSD